MPRTPNITPVLFFVAFAVVAWIVWTSISQPGLGEWEGKMEEIGFFKNENNTGPVRRIYAVYVREGDDADMKRYADQLPHTKYGYTTVYFFAEKAYTPTTIRLQAPHFDPVFNEYCVAFFEKNSMGQVRFTSNPFDKIH